MLGSFLSRKNLLLSPYLEFNIGSWIVNEVVQSLFHNNFFLFLREWINLFVLEKII